MNWKNEVGRLYHVHGRPFLRSESGLSASKGVQVSIEYAVNPCSVRSDELELVDPERKPGYLDHYYKGVGLDHLSKTSSSKLIARHRLQETPLRGFGCSTSHREPVEVSTAECSKGVSDISRSPAAVAGLKLVVTRLNDLVVVRIYTETKRITKCAFLG
jgi:hypothetical protein